MTGQSTEGRVTARFWWTLSDALRLISFQTGKHRRWRLGSSKPVRHFVARWRASLPDGLKRALSGPNSPPPKTAGKKIVASARQTTWLLLRDAEKLEVEERAFIEHLVEISPVIAEAQTLAQEFNRILKQRDQAAFPGWMERASRSRIPEMKSLAAGIERDRAAVAAALEYEWSNGPTEGHINRLKTLKKGDVRKGEIRLVENKNPCRVEIGDGPETLIKTLMR